MNGFERKVIKSAIKLGFNVKPQPSRLDRSPKLDSRRAYPKMIMAARQAIKETQSKLKPLLKPSRPKDIASYSQYANSVVQAYSAVQSAYRKLESIPELKKKLTGEANGVSVQELLNSIEKAKQIIDNGGNWSVAINGIVSGAKRVSNTLSFLDTVLDWLEIKTKS